jgi:hypothetical protein
MIWFIAIKTFFRFHEFFFNRIEIKRFENIRRSKIWRTILIEISYCRFNEDRFNFLIDRDRDHNDADCTTDRRFRFDLDSCSNDCIRSFTKLDVINTLIMILFQLSQTSKLVNVLYDVEFWKHYVLQSIEHFSF